MFLLVLGLIAVFWATHTRLKELAIRAAIRACQRAGTQFLDGTAHFQKCHLGRHEKRRGVFRHYSFDYYDGQSRKVGSVILFGNHTFSIKMQSHAPIEPTKPLQTTDNILPFTRKETDKEN